ncbi:MAG: hypothetical protein O3B41_11680 [Bacteroidetes bacterium]|nr:hypothetical protein [Bacteroidota bacterium]
MPKQVLPPKEIANVINEVKDMTSTEAVFHMAKQLVDTREQFRAQCREVARLAERESDLVRQLMAYMKDEWKDRDGFEEEEPICDFDESRNPDV